LHGGEVNGPAANPFLTQLATVSLTSFPKFSMFDAFGMWQAGSTVLWNDFALHCRSSMLCAALFCSATVIWFFLFLTSFEKFSMFMSLMGFFGRSNFGNSAQ
jgi:hypothetical protein